MLITPRAPRIPVIATWLLRRIGFAAIVLLVVIIINFIVIMHAVNNTFNMTDMYIPEDVWRAMVLRQYGLHSDGPWWELFLEYIKNCLTFNFGYSLYYR